MVVRRALLVFLLAFGLLGGRALATEQLNPYALQGDFMCVSCHEPLNQVNSPESQAEKADLVRFVHQGLSFNQIKSEMISIYGEGVLAQPPAQGISLLVYILPPLVLLGGLGLLAYNLPRWRRRGRLDATWDGGSLPASVGAADAERLDRELAQFRG
jgi:cytochrome c-type biogenesis protein CcmH